MDTEGQLVTEKNLLGNWVLLHFGYTSSPDVGPAEVRKMANSINSLGSTLLLCLKLKHLFVCVLSLKCLTWPKNKNRRRISRSDPYLLQLILSGTPPHIFVLIFEVSCSWIIFSLTITNLAFMKRDFCYNKFVGDWWTYWKSPKRLCKSCLY